MGKRKAAECQAECKKKRYKGGKHLIGKITKGPSREQKKGRAK